MEGGVVKVGKILYVTKSYSNIQFSLTPCSFIVDIKRMCHSKFCIFLTININF